MSIYSCQTMLCKFALEPHPTFLTENGEKIINRFKNVSHFDVERLTNKLFF